MGVSTLIAGASRESQFLCALSQWSWPKQATKRQHTTEKAPQRVWETEVGTSLKLTGESFTEYARNSSWSRLGQLADWMLLENANPRSFPAKLFTTTGASLSRNRNFKRMKCLRWTNFVRQARISLLRYFFLRRPSGCCCNICSLLFRIYGRDI